MPRVTKVMYSITKQVRRYEPVEVEITVERGANEDHLTDEQMVLYARNACEEAIRDAMVRNVDMAADNYVHRPQLPGGP